MLYAGLYLLSVYYQLITVINQLNRSTAVSEKLVFRVGKKKRWQTDKLYCNFWMRVGSCELQLCLAVWGS